MRNTQTMKSIPRTQDLETCFEKYPLHSKEATIKSDILRLGLRFSNAALKACRGFQNRTYYLFSYDAAEAEQMGKQEMFQAPEHIKINGGRYGLRPTVTQVRLAPTSPYLVDIVDGKLMLCDDNPNVLLAEVKLRRPSKYYFMTLKDGTPYYKIVQEICWGYRAFITVLQDCQYWKDNRQCQFCDINANVKRLKSISPVVVFKSIDEIVEVCKAICTEDGTEPVLWQDEPALGLPSAEAAPNESAEERRPRTFIIEGGTITTQVGGMDDTAFYLNYVKAIKKAIGNRHELTLGIGAKPKEEMKRLYDAGVNVVLQDMEVWDEKMFNIICPGKAREMSRDEWVRRMIEAVDVFGEGNVQTALVGGVEMAQPHGFKDIDSAVKSTTEGMEYLMSNGVFPEIFIWNISPFSALAGHSPVPLEYYVRMNGNLIKLWKKYRMPVPALSQPVGPGNSVYNQSPYIDAY